MLEIEKNLILRFLIANYPVYRLKHNSHFKRTIVLESGEEYQLSNKGHLSVLYTKLMEILRVVFNSDKKISEDALKDFLHLKPSYSNKL